MTTGKASRESAVMPITVQGAACDGVTDDSVVVDAAFTAAQQARQDSGGHEPRENSNQQRS